MTLQAQTRAVEVDVVVLNGRGEPVTGLRRDDFLVAEDGQPQAVTFFEEHPAATGGEEPTAANVLLIDTLNTSKEDLSFARRRVSDYLKKMPAGTTLAIFSLGQTLRMVQGFTADRGLLLAAVENKANGAYSETSAASNMPADDADDREREAMLSAAQAGQNSTDMARNAQSMHKAYQSDRRIAMTVAALERLARYLARTPGRKNLVWFSSSFPIALFPEPGARDSLATTEQGSQIRRATDLLAVARVAIYPVNAQGVAPEAMGDASSQYSAGQHVSQQAAAGAAGPAGATQQSTGGDDYQYGALSGTVRGEFSNQAANYAAMSALASATGGTMLPAGNDLNKTLARAIVDGSHYYTLTYTPTNAKSDGSFRRIRITLRKGGETPAYRRGYYATDAMPGAAPAPAATPAAGNIARATAPKSGDPLSPLMRPGIADSAAVRYEAQVERVEPQPAAGAPQVGGNARVTGPTTRYRVNFMVHRAAADTQGAGPDKMQLEAIAYSADGDALNWQAGALPLTPQEDAEARQEGIHTHMLLDVPNNAASLATGVYDWKTGQAGTRQMSMSSVTAQPAAGSAASSTPATAAVRNPGLVHRTPEIKQQQVAAARQIHLQTVVTDGAGKPVSGLRQVDFTVLDTSMGQAQTLDAFRAIDGLTSDPPVEIVLVLDTMNTSFGQVAVARQGVESFLRQNGGRMALPVSGVFLTDTGVQATRAVRDGNALAAEIEKLPTPIHVIDSAQGLDGLMLRFQRSVDALSRILKYEATKPGRKLLIWVGSGWPMLDNSRFELSPGNNSSFFASIVSLSTTLREAQVTLYGVIPLDMDQGNNARAFMYRTFLKPVETAKQAGPGNLSLQVLAEQSGGLAIGPTGDIAGAIARCAADADAYYELSFASEPAKRVDVYHGLTVTVDKPGLTARTNSGYYAQP